MEKQSTSTTPRTAYVLLVVAAGVVCLMGMQQLAGIVAPLLLTINLFIAAYPIQSWLVRVGVPRIVAQSLLGLVVLLILALFLYALVWSVGRLLGELPGYEQQFVNLYNGLVDQLSRFGVTETWLLDQLRSLSPANFAGIIRGALGGLTGALTIVVVVVTMVFMVTIDAGTLPTRDRMLAERQPAVSASMGDFIVGVRRYWVVSTIFGLIVAVIDAIALIVLGVPLALVWGILAFLTNYIPNVGFVIGVVPPALMALVANGPVNALAVVIVYSVVNFVIQAIIQPKFNGDAVGVSATVSFLSLMLWSFVLGALGALIALPMTLLAKAMLVDADPQMRWLNAFLSNEPRNARPSRRLVPAAPLPNQGKPAPNAPGEDTGEFPLPTDPPARKGERP